MRGCAATPPSRFALGRLQAPANNQTDTTNNRANRLKSKAAAKIRRHAQAFRVRRIFLRRRTFCFYMSCFLLSTVLFAPSFLRTVYIPFRLSNAIRLFFLLRNYCKDRDIPLFSSLYSVWQKQVMLPFVTRDSLRVLYCLSI